MNIRDQIVDCIKYIRRNNSIGLTAYIDRSIVEQPIGIFSNGATLRDIIDVVGENLIEHAHISAVSSDTDGYSDYDTVEFSIHRKQTDQEYFDSLATMICPSNYQLQEYEQYQRLKFKYGD